MIHTTVEEIIEADLETMPRHNYRITSAGLYVPDRPAVYFNSRYISNKWQAKITLVHELLHHLDVNWEWTEEQVETSAWALLNRNKDIDSYISERYKRTLNKYWDKEW